VPESKYTADFFFPSKGVIVEINGPSHYIKNIVDGKIKVTDELNGRSKNKEKSFKDMGLKLVIINYQEFTPTRSQQEIAEFVRSRIN